MFHRQRGPILANVKGGGAQGLKEKGRKVTSLNGGSLFTQLATITAVYFPLINPEILVVHQEKIKNVKIYVRWLRCKGSFSYENFY